VAERREAAKELADRIARETDPVIVAGDFNTPARGRVYHAFANELVDTFEKRGRGFGFTFPGKTRNPFSLFGPWLRLDIIFAGKDWRVVDHIVEPDRPAQHRAVVSTLELREE
jgi:endonuclease/exonuclease/phosphatase (EEP) superfamily protein YafD